MSAHEWPDDEGVPARGCVLGVLLGGAMWLAMLVLFGLVTGIVR